MDEKNGRRISRRQVLATTGVVSVSLVAGCSGGGGSDTENSDGGGGATPTSEPTETATATKTATATETQSMDVSGATSSKIDQLSIVDHEPRIGYFGQEEQTYFPVDITVENGGDKQTDVTKYNYDVVAYDADGNDVTGSQGGYSAGEGTEMGPGERGSLVVYSTIKVQPSEVARYEITIVCEGAVSRAEGTYCQ